MTGRAEVAVDPVGNDNTDLLVRLRPMATWTTASDFDALSTAMKSRIESNVPDTFVSVSQPIEDKTNELISGSRSDVAVNVFGPEIEPLARLTDRVGNRLKAIRGTGDVRIERQLGKPVIDASVDRERLARWGVRVEDAFAVVAAAREGMPVGTIYEEHRRFDLRVLQPPVEPTAEGLGDLFVGRMGGGAVPLREVMTLREGEGPLAVRREDRERTARIDVNLRGRDLASWVDEARRVIEHEVRLEGGHRVEWGGQFENFERAKARLKVVLPATLGVIFGMLLWMFRSARLAVGVFLTVPFAMTGGMLGLMLRGLTFSLPAAVGFIALGGITVLNGVVMTSEVRRRVEDGELCAPPCCAAAST